MTAACTIGPEMTCSDFVGAILKSWDNQGGAPLFVEEDLLAAGKYADNIVKEAVSVGWVKAEALWFIQQQANCAPTKLEASVYLYAIGVLEANGLLG